MNEMQKKILYMFKWFHAFCEENNLTYYALGGTALGAIRHNGFIPWDDDIDIGMPRPFYERLVKMLKKENIFGQYVIEYPLEKNDSMYPFLKLYDMNTTLVENVRNHPKRGIFIDIFPLDGIGDTLEDSVRNYKKIAVWIDILNTKICALRKGRSLKKNIAIIFSGLLPNRIFGKDVLIKKINELGKTIDYNKSSYCVNLFGAWKEREISEIQWFGIPKLVRFEDTWIYVPEKAEKYLTALYGNYMELPPMEDRLTHHDFIELDLEKSYI